MWDKLFSGVDLIHKGMSVAWTRDHVIRNNIANAETPGFKGSTVEFETILARSLERPNFAPKMTNERHIPVGHSEYTEPMSVDPVIRRHEDLSMRMDENNVDVEAENVKLAQNAIQYNTLMAKLNSELTRIKFAINEGR